MTFIIFINDTKAAKVRFFDAIVDQGATVKRAADRQAPGAPYFLVEAPDRDAFAKACGAETRPAITEDAPTARPAKRSY